MTTFADRMKAFNRSLRFEGALPENIRVMHPFVESPVAPACADAFYEKYYNDNTPRRMLLGINPGRHGSGQTGVPFNDFKRLREIGIPVPEGISSHELSSEFVQRVVDALGGPALFYRKAYLHSVCPLGFLVRKKTGQWVNYNYYDDKVLEALATPFIIRTLREQIALGCRTDKVVIMGRKNAEYLRRLNDTHGFFGEIIDVPHPRFVMQYRRRYAEEYVAEYVRALTT